MADLVLLLAPISLFLVLVGHLATFFLLSRKRVPCRPPPAITILKPVKGAEPGLYENLASLAAQDYPDFEMLVGAEDARDPALAVARQVQRDFPAGRVKVFTGARRMGLNPKVNLLASLADKAAHDLVLISDSNVRVCPAYLRETASELTGPEVGLVTNVLVGTGTGAGAVLENLHLNSFVASSASLVRVAAGRACVIGKSMLFRLSDLQKLGGFWAVRNVLAEDFVIGRSFELAGFKVALSPYLVHAVNDGWTVERFVNRHLRWAQMRRRVSPAAYCAEVMLNPVLWIALSGCALALSRRGLDLRFVGIGAAGIAVKCASDALLSRRLAGRFPRLTVIALVPVKDLLIAGLWAVGAFRRKIDWRGHVLRIEAGSELTEPVSPEAQMEVA
jgi:ceramide glucosyltransferase